MIDRLFPNEVVTAACHPSSERIDGLLPEERSQIRRAVHKRQREYAAGRYCARNALGEFGVRRFALVNDADRVPMWPSEFVGSVTHCESYCGAVVARKHPILGLGLDVEPLRELDDVVRALVCTPAEEEFLSAARGEGVAWSKVIFSAKESFYKSFFPLFRTHLDFEDVEIAIEVPDTFRAHLLAETPAGYERLHVAGHFIIAGNLVLTGVMVSE